MRISSVPAGLLTGFQRLHQAALPSLEGLSPSEKLAARALSAVLVICLSWFALWFAIALPFLVVRKIAGTVLSLAVSGCLVVSLVRLRKGHVRQAVWIFTAAVWTWAAVIVLLSGGIRSIALVSFLPGAVVAGMLLGQHVATLSCVIFLSFALVLAILEIAGVRLPPYFPLPPLTIWMGAVLSALVVGLPLDRLLRFLRESLETMQRQVDDLNATAGSLRESEARYRGILDSARDAIVVIDADTGDLLNANPAANVLTAGHVRQLQDLLMAQWYCAGEQAFPRGDAPSPAAQPGLTESILTRADGLCAPVELAASVVVVDQGRRLLVGVFRDISERKIADLERAKLAEQLQQSQKLETVGRLAGGVAHDFNNLLMVINGYSEFMLEKLPAGHENRQPLEQIRKAGDRAASLTQQLLAFSRKQIVQPRPIDLKALLTDIRPMLESLLNEDIGLSMQLENTPPILADPGQIHQVIVNLSVNARDAMPAGGKLTIASAMVEFASGAGPPPLDLRPGAYILLTVTDTGTGMTEEVRQHIFEPFFTTKKVGRGTGLGLSTVYGIVQQNLGGVAVESEPGKGSTFKVYLPCDRAATPVEEEPAVPAARAAGWETILVVEDQENVRILTAQILRTAGYRVLEAANGFEALLQAERHSGDLHLAVTDVIMPGLTGPELAAQLRSLRPDTQVIYMSGYSEEALAHRGKLDPGVFYIAKPFTPANLIAKVHEVLAGARKY